MRECSALATKQELESLRKQFINLDQEVDGKVNESDKPYIIQTAAGIGSTAALALLDPKVRQTLAKVASLGSQIGDLFAKYANVLSIISTLASVTALTILQIRVAKLEGKTEVLEVLVEALEIENNELRKSLNKSNEKLNKTIETSNLATSKANQVISSTNDHAKTVTSLRLENAALKQKTDSLTLELATQKTALEEANKKIEDYKTGVEPVVKEYVTRKVRESQITTYGDITGLKTSAQQLESSIDRRNREVIRDVKELEKRVVAIQDVTLNPGNTGASNERERIGGGGITTTQVKDLVDSQINSRLGEINSVNDAQYKNVLDQLKNIPVVTGAVVTGALAPTLKPIADNVSRTVTQTSAPAIVQAASQGVCNSTRPGGCMQRNVVDKLTGNVGDLINAGGTAISAANNALLLKMNGTLNSIKGTVTTIKSITNTTLGVVQHAKYGLEASFKFAQTAWKATRIGKVLEYLSLAATIHNAAMLSRNLGGSLGDTISAIANNTISLIKNEEFQGININETLGNSIEGFLKNLIGAENYTGVSETLSKYNRIINSASNVIYSITSIQAGLAQGLETIGNYTGRIGNALKKSGQVLESSYGWMSEKTSVKTGRLGQIQRVINTGEGVENVLSDVENATQEFRGSQESVNNIGQQYKKVKTEFTKQETEKAALETTVKTNSQGAQPELTDFVKDPIEE